MSYPNMTEEMEAAFDRFFDGIEILPVSPDIARITWELRRSVKIKLPDAIVAATALLYGLTLITRNTQDFKNVPGLTVVNPHELF
jgi:predicted nucleic acid-binding protein